jgi:hypothetical protein
LNGWISVLLCLYLVVAYSVHLIRCYRCGDYKRHAEHAKKLFDGVTFAGSLMLMIGVLYDDTVLKLIGDTTLYLVIGGVAGLGYSIRALIPQWG